MKQILLISLSTAISFLAFNQNGKDLDCLPLHKSTYKYLNFEDTIAYFKIDTSSQIEYHQNGKFTIKPKLTWLKNCLYSMTILSDTIPDFPFKLGGVMIVTINKIEGNVIFFTSEVNMQSW